MDKEIKLQTSDRTLLRSRMVIEVLREQIGFKLILTDISCRDFYHVIFLNHFRSNYCEQKCLKLVNSEII